MTLTELRYAIVVAKEKNFSRAAKICNISQPSLSSAISKLEASLGVLLFERNHNEISVTDIGKTIIAQAHATLEAAEKISCLADEGKSQLCFPLKIGAIYTVAPFLFPKFIPNFIDLAPKTPLLIQENFTENLCEQLKNGDVDAIFVGFPITEPGIVIQKIYQEKLVVLMRNDHPLSQYEKITPADLVNEKILLLGEKHCLRDQIIKMCPFCIENDTQKQTVGGVSLDTLRHMVASGMGITILPCSAVRMDYYNTTLCTKPLDDEHAFREIGLAWRASFPRTKAIDVIMQALNKAELNKKYIPLANENAKT